MVKKISSRSRSGADDDPVEEHSLQRWTNTSRFMALLPLFAEENRRDGEVPPASLMPPKPLVTQNDKEALAIAGLALLVIAIVALIAGLL